MRHTRGFVFLASALLAAPAAAAAQVFVISPAAGSESSYRRSVLRWLPIPGASEYHLQVDDDPAFRSPEVDVIVNQPFYRLRGETLRLNGQLSWAAYVRINGVRWEWPAFSPSYIERAFWPEIAVDARGTVHYGFLGASSGKPHAALTSSDDFSSVRVLSPPERDGNPHGIALDVDPAGVVHAFWTEQVGGRPGLPFYANSIDWTLLQLGDSSGGIFDVGPSMVLTGSRIDVFEESFGPVQWFSSVDGRTFTRSTVPNSSHSVTAEATRDPAGGILLAAERLRNTLVLQHSATGWFPHVIGAGRYPSAAVGSNGVVHVLKRLMSSGEVSYSNSARAFGTWTPLPVPPVVGQQLLPIVVDDHLQRLYAAAHATDGTRLCAAAISGHVWTCRRIGGPQGSHPDLKLDSAGVLHLAWADVLGGGYANSLGSFLAVNLSPEVRFEAPIDWPNTIIVDTGLADPDGDAVSGSVAAGVSEHRRTHLRTNDRLPMLGDDIVNNGAALLARRATLLFRGPGGDWSPVLALGSLTSFPARIEVRRLDRRAADTFTIAGWNITAVVIDQVVFTALIHQTFEGAALPSLDLQPVAPGAAMLRVELTDGDNLRVFNAPFVRAPGQATMAFVDFVPAADAVRAVVASMPGSHFKAPSHRSVLLSHIEGIVAGIEGALAAPNPAERAHLLTEAEARLRASVLQRADGCATTGAPDPDDWVIHCGDQTRFAGAAAGLLRAVDALR